MAWTHDPDGVSCSECAETYKGNPPCDSCGMPRELFPNNKFSYEMWKVCDKHRQIAIGAGGAFAQRLELGAVLSLISTYDGTRLDFEKIIIIEDVAHPIIQANIDKASEEEQNAGIKDRD